MEQAANQSEDVNIDFLYMFQDVDKIMNLFKDDRFTVTNDAISAIKSALSQIGDSKTRIAPNTLLTAKDILDSKHVDPRIQAKCFKAIENLRKMRPLLSIYDDTAYL